MPCGCKKTGSWTPPRDTANKAAAAATGRPKVWTGSKPAAKADSAK